MASGSAFVISDPELQCRSTLAIRTASDGQRLKALAKLLGNAVHGFLAAGIDLHSQLCLLVTERLPGGQLVVHDFNTCVGDVTALLLALLKPVFDYFLRCFALKNQAGRALIFDSIADQVALVLLQMGCINNQG